MQQDSTLTQQEQIKPALVDTNGQRHVDTASVPVVSVSEVVTSKPELVQIARKSIKAKKEVPPKEQKNIQVDTMKVIKPVQEKFVPFTLFPNISNKDSSIYRSHTEGFTYSGTRKTDSLIQPKLRNDEQTIQKDWVFGVAVFTTLILLVIRIYFHKHLSTIISSSVNLQLADKLMREKNVLVKRVFFMLNLNFVITISLYLYIVVQRVSISLLEQQDFFLFALIALIIILILFVRLIFLYLVANVFQSLPVIREYIHNTYLLNKNLGLYLLPILISIFYLPENISSIGFYAATSLIGITFIYKYLRSLQIILRHKVLYFYTILYLCTLEILPALVGFKFVLSLR